MEATFKNQDRTQDTENDYKQLYARVNVFKNNKSLCQPGKEKETKKQNQHVVKRCARFIIFIRRDASIPSTCYPICQEDSPSCGPP